jgi:branched-chain amino acid transport system permease protein
VDILVIHLFNALLYASVLFLIAGGLSLTYGVMRIVNLAHGSLFALGAFATASAVGQWFAGSTSWWLYLLLPAGAFLAAALGAVLEPTLLRPFYRRPGEYQLLVTFGLLLILEDVMRFAWGPYPISASVLFEKTARCTSASSSIRATTSSSLPSARSPRSSSGRSSTGPDSAWCCGSASARTQWPSW